MSKLKPCPFCGSDDRIILIPSDNSLMADYRSKDEVYCRDCGANQYALGKLKAIKKWNTRPVEDALRAENETLKAKLKEYEDMGTAAYLYAKSEDKDRITKLEADNARMREALEDLEVNLVYLYGTDNQYEYQASGSPLKVINQALKEVEK